MEVVGTGQNTTWRAMDLNTKKVCALKEFKESFDSMSDQKKKEFMEECQTLREMGTIMGDSCTRLFTDRSFSCEGVKKCVTNEEITVLSENVAYIVMEL